MSFSNTKATARPLPKAATSQRSHWQQYWELTKPRLSMLSVITAIIGYLAALSSQNWWEFCAFLIGTTLAAGSAGALNQWLEWETDAKMVRTQNRPIPSGALAPTHALAFGLILGLLGCFLLFSQVNALAGSIAAATILSYVLVYTPLKKVTHWNTEIGAIPGALPPLIGWAAAAGRIDALGWILFAILLAWQIPHFMAIAWNFRKDYAQGGYAMISVLETVGKQTSLRALFFAALLLIVSLLPPVFAMTTWYGYGLIALICGSLFLSKAWKFYRAEPKEKAAKSLFLISIAYLPIVLLALIVDRWFLL